MGKVVEGWKQKKAVGLQNGRMLVVSTFRQQTHHPGTGAGKDRFRESTYLP